MQMLNEFLKLAAIARENGDKTLARFYMRKADKLLAI